MIPRVVTEAVVASTVKAIHPDLLRLHMDRRYASETLEETHNRLEAARWNRLFKAKVAKRPSILRSEAGQ